MKHFYEPALKINKKYIWVEGLQFIALQMKVFHPHSYLSRVNFLLGKRKLHVI